MLLVTSMRKSFLLVILVAPLFASAQMSNLPQQTPGAPQPARPQLGQPPAPAQSPPHPQVSDEEAMAQAAKTAQATMNWDTSTTPGTKAEVMLIKKGDYQGRPMMDYRLKITGAPPGRQYTLMAWPVMLEQPVAAMEGLAIAADGTVGCPADSTKSCAQRIKGAELHLIYVPAKGEIYRHALISEDHQTRIFFSIIPDPMIASDKACSLEVVRLSPQFELVMVRGKGFQPGEEIRFHSQSYQEIHDVAVTADSRGEFGAHLTPMIKGRVAGTSTVVAAGKSCAPTISFDWGTPPPQATPGSSALKP
ncbi:MAG TPA: hypothetical protein VI488_20685 [Candidatus Angelobacter sp.]